MKLILSDCTVSDFHKITAILFLSVSYEGTQHLKVFVDFGITIMHENQLPFCANHILQNSSCLIQHLLASFQSENSPKMNDGS